MRLEGRLVGPFGNGVYYLTEHDHEVLRPKAISWYERHMPKDVDFQVAHKLISACASYLGAVVQLGGNTIIPSDFTDWFFSVFDMRNKENEDDEWKSESVGRGN